MDLKVKQRIVGLVVVLALLGIFIPMISYKMQPKNGIHLSTTIPAAPVATSLAAAQNQPPVQNKVIAQNGSPQLAPSAPSGEAVLSEVAAKDLDKASQDELTEANETDVSTSGKEKLTQLPADERTSKDTEKLAKMSAEKQAVSGPQKPVIPSTAEGSPRIGSVHEAGGPSAVLGTTAVEGLNPHAGHASLHGTAGAGHPPHHSATWIVQLGTFSSQKNIRILETKLASKGIPSFQQHGRSNSGAKIVRIYVGPLSTQRQALNMKKELQNRLHISGIIKRNTA
jgi:cell division septation protein DedD